MRTYYRGPDALITDEYFVWWTAGQNRVYTIHDLHHVGLVRDDGVDRRPDMATVAAVGMVGFAGTAWLTAGPVVGMAVGFIAAIAAVVAISTRQHRTEQSWQVHAGYRGVDTVIYRSSDARVFNQVTRALQRSLEDDRPERSTYGLAAA